MHAGAKTIGKRIYKARHKEKIGFWETFWFLCGAMLELLCYLVKLFDGEEEEEEEEVNCEKFRLDE